MVYYYLNKNNVACRHYYIYIYIDELKQILLTCGLTYYQRGALKLILYGWSICMMDNDLQNNYFDKFNVRQFKNQQWNIYYIGIGLHETI